jgi:hypothetical protein
LAWLGADSTQAANNEANLSAVACNPAAALLFCTQQQRTCTTLTPRVDIWCCIAGNTATLLTDLLQTVKDGFKEFQTTQDAVIQALDDQLSDRIDAVNSSLSGCIQALDTKLSTRIQDLDDKLSDRIQALDNKLTALIQQRACDLQNEVANTHNTVNYMQRLLLVPDGQKPGGQGVKGT